MTEIKKQVYGVEIEMVGIGNRKGAETLAKLFGTSAYYKGQGYDKWCAKDAKGREWVCMNDGSLSGCVNTEMVTPVLGWDDIELLQQAVRAMRAEGGKADKSCGVHVHVGADEHNSVTLKNLLNLVYTRYDLLEKALQFTNRKSWCKKANTLFMEELNKHAPKDMDELAQDWYGYGVMNVNPMKPVWKKASNYDVDCAKHQHYHGSRYQLVNLHSYFQGKGVEFRAFNGTVHAGEIKAYVQFCCALNAKAINVSKTTMKHQEQVVSEYWQMSDWLKTMGIKGNNPEFKTLRHHLLKNLSKERA